MTTKPDFLSLSTLTARIKTTLTRPEVREVVHDLASLEGVDEETWGNLCDELAELIAGDLL